MARTKAALQTKYNVAAVAKPGTADDADASKKKRRRKDPSGARFRREVRREQASTKCALPLAAMDRLIREVAVEVAGPESAVRFSPNAIRALREVVQTEGIEMMKSAFDVTCNRGSVTLSLDDLKVANKLRSAAENRFRVCGN